MKIIISMRILLLILIALSSAGAQQGLLHCSINQHTCYYDKRTGSFEYSFCYSYVVRGYYETDKKSPNYGKITKFIAPEIYEEAYNRIVNEVCYKNTYKKHRPGEELSAACKKTLENNILLLKEKLIPLKQEWLSHCPIIGGCYNEYAEGMVECEEREGE